jgi:S-DNA-T family DNA segregation ATPase FtsK/SpoIIIE
VIGAIVIGLVLSSPFLLLFAALGPIVAIAGMVDSRRSARRHRRAEAERFDRECALFERAIDDAHLAERLDADGRHPRGARSLAGEQSATVLRVGTGEAPSAVAAETVRAVGDSDHDRRLSRMLARARHNPELPALIARGRIILVGGGMVAEVIARRLEHEPGVDLHRRAVDEHSEPAAGGVGSATTISVLSATAIEVREPGRSVRRVRPEFITARQLDAAREAAPTGDPVPSSVTWSEVSEASGTGITDGDIPIGIGETGVVAIDLIGAGPHALVGGTTGSGKSELLRALALGWAASASPSSAQLLFVDFKGGATFDRLTELPHAVGLVTDLDPIVAQRAVRSLRAELRNRERALADAGLRDVREQPSLLPRLLVLVDEFATLVSTFPELHAEFSDVAARGRSLGVHLVLCTQHPASVVRDAIAANCPVRLSFRVTDAGSGGIIGERARELIAAPPGRAVLVDEHGSRLLQVAVVADGDIDLVLDRWRGHPSGSSMWCAPLPSRLTLKDVPPIDVTGNDADGAATGLDRNVIDSVTFGVLDNPDEGLRQRAVWTPARDGSLVVLGAPRSGRSTLLSTLAAATPRHARTVVLPGTVPEAWHVLEHLAAHTEPATLLICDGLDVLLAQAGDRSSEVLARWDSAVRTVRTRGGAAAAAMSAASSSGSVLSGRFESRVVLRCADADEHAMAGAPRGLFDRRVPAGRGWWRDLQLQVIKAEHPLPDAEPALANEWRPSPDRDAIVVASRVDEVAERIRSAHPSHRIEREIQPRDAISERSSQEVELAPRILLATPARWQAAWSVLTAARDRLPIALVGVDESEVRGLLGHRDALPPLAPAQGEFWLAQPGDPIIRARWNVLLPPSRAPAGAA